MAKKPISSSLILFLGLLAIAAAVFLQYRRTGEIPLLGPLLKSTGESLFAPNAPSLLPPLPDEIDSVSSREREALNRWQGTPVPEILDSLQTESAPAPSGGPNPKPLQVSPEGISDPLLPLYRVVERNDSAGVTLPFEDAAAIEDGVLFLSSDRPLSFPSGESTAGGRRLLPADFDRDGDLDLFVGRGGALPDSLLRQKEDGSFEDITTASGLLRFADFQIGEWVDFDRDGRLDLCLVFASESESESTRIHLYRNIDDNRFESIIPFLNLPRHGSIRDLLWRDLDGDAFPDLLLSLAGAKPSLALLLAIPTESPRHWSFTDVTEACGLSDFPGGGPLAWGDLTGDGREEWICAADNEWAVLTRPDPQSTSPLLPPFENVAKVLELEGIPTPLSLLCEDLDGDGFLDLIVTGGSEEAPAARAWWNVGGIRLREIPGAAGLTTLQRVEILRRLDPLGNGIASLFLSGSSGAQEMRPVDGTTRDHAHVRIGFRKDAEKSLPGFLGARLHLEIVDQSRTRSELVRTVDEPFESIGLGTAESIASLRVLWPDRERTETTWEKLPVDVSIGITHPPEPVTTTPLPAPVIPIPSSLPSDSSESTQETETETETETEAEAETETETETETEAEAEAETGTKAEAEAEETA